MSTIRPFRAVRPKKELASKVASKPYDVLNSAEAREETKGDDYTFLHVVKSEIDLSENTDVYDPSVYETARNNFQKFITDGVLFKEEKPMLYIYSQTMNGRTQYGIVACAAVEEYENDTIKKHEFTRKVKEDDRIRHVSTVNANTGPVFLTYKDHEGVNAIVSDCIKSQPEYDFTSADGITHKAWLIDDEALTSKIQACFDEIPVLYVADGHHRTASAAKVGSERKAANPNHTGKEEYNFFLSVLFP